jgi:hypothetical protein
MIIKLVKEEIDAKSCSPDTLITTIYILYVVMYEEAYKFNPENQVTFTEI